MPLSQLLHLVGLGLSRSLDRGDELLVRPSDLPLPDGDLLLPLHHLDLNLLQADLLLLLGCLQLVGQLGLCFLKTSVHETVTHTRLRLHTSCLKPAQFRLYLSVDFLVERSLLQLQLPFGVGHLGVSLEFDVHHLLPTLSFLLRQQSKAVGSCARQNPTSQRRPPCQSLLTRIPASLSASATPMSASLCTAAVWVFPRELR